MKPHSFILFSILIIAFSSYGMENREKNKTHLSNDKALISNEKGRFIINSSTNKEIQKVGAQCDSLVIDKNKQTIVIFTKADFCNTDEIGVYDIKTNHLKNIKHIDDFYPMMQYEFHTIGDIAFYPYDNNIIAILSLIDAQHGHSRLMNPNFVQYWDIKREKLIGSTFVKFHGITDSLSFCSDAKNIVLNKYFVVPIADRIDFVKRNIFRLWCLKNYRKPNVEMPQELRWYIIKMLHQTYTS